MKRIKLFSVLFLSLSLIFGLTTVAKKPSLSDLQKQQSDNAKKLTELANQLQDVKKELKDTYIGVEKIKGEVEVATTKYQIALGTYNETKREYDDLNKRLTSSKQFQADVSAQINQNADNLAASKQQLSILARNEMLNGGNDNTILLLTGAKNADEVKDSYLVYKTLERYNKNVLSKYRETMGYALNNQSRLEEVNAIISDLTAKAESVYKKAQKAKQETEAEKAKLTSLQAQLNQKAANLESKKAVYLKQQKAIEKKQKVLNAEIAKISDNVDYGNGAWGRPLKSLTVSQAWGWRIHPIWGYKSFHTGVDLSASCGTPIYAIGNGKVQKVSYDSIWGNRTVISHGTVNGKSFVSTYNHQKSVIVSAGQTVSRGQKIGYVGTTGWSTGCHLHFEIYIGGTSVNPMNYIS